MNKADIENYISAEDIKEIAIESGLSVGNVRLVLNGKVKRSKAKKFIIARIEKNKKIIL